MTLKGRATGFKHSGAGPAIFQVGDKWVRAWPTIKDDSESPSYENPAFVAGEAGNYGTWTGYSRAEEYKGRASHKTYLRTFSLSEEEGKESSAGVKDFEKLAAVCFSYAKDLIVAHGENAHEYVPQLLSIAEDLLTWQKQNSVDVGVEPQ